MSFSPVAQIEWTQSHAVLQSNTAWSTQACVQLTLQHEGLAAHTALTHGSVPGQSVSARSSQLWFQLGPPQHEACCMQTSSTHGSVQSIGSSLLPTKHTECSHVVGGHTPQSAGHVMQVSPLSHALLPHELHCAHIWLASFTHWPSHAVSQQYGSTGHTVAAHASHATASGPPC